MSSSAIPGRRALINKDMQLTNFLLLFVVKQFIRNVRAAKTIADERAVIQKESAAIRASFREETHDHSVRYVSRPTCSRHNMLDRH